MSATSPHVDGGSHPDRDRVAPRSQAGRTGKAKATDKARLLTIDDLDKRTLSAKYALQLRSALINERGGEGNMSVLKLAAADQVSILNAIVSDLSTRWLRGDEVDLSELVSVTNAFRRASEQLGAVAKPQAKTISIDHDDPRERRQLARAMLQVLEGADADSDDLPSTWEDDDPATADELVRRTAAAASEVPASTPKTDEPTSQSEILDALRSLDPSSWHYKPAAKAQVGEIELVGDAGHFIELLSVGNDRRLKFAVCDASGERVTAVWGKAEAIAACNTLISKGAITRRATA